MENVSANAIDWSLTHIERFGDTDFFPIPFEFKAIRHCWNRIRPELLAVDLEQYRPNSASPPTYRLPPTDYFPLALNHPIC
jgi:hypothetical protein